MHDEYEPAEDAHAPVGDDRKTGRGRAQQRRRLVVPLSIPQSCLPGVWAGAAVTRGVLGRAAGPLGHARGGTLARSPEYRSTCASRISWSTTGRVLGGRSAGRGTTDLVSEVERGVVALPLWRTRASRSAGAKGERGAGGRLGGRAIRLMWVSAYLIERGEWEVPALSMSRWELFAPRLIRLPMRGAGQRWGGTSSTG